MTAIIIIVVVALVFFVSICVVTFMVWKHETEMRTDSLKAIEKRLEALSGSMSGDDRIAGKATAEKIKNDVAQLAGEPEIRHMFRERSADPFSWMRNEKEKPQEEQSQPELSEERRIREKLAVYDFEPEADFDVSAGEPREDYIHIHEKPVRSTMTMDEREKLYADIDLSFAEIKELVSEMKSAETGKADLEQQSFGQQDPEYQMSEYHDSEPGYQDMAEISLPEIEGDDEIYVVDFDFDEPIKEPIDDPRKGPIQYDVGRSGRRYTEEELSALIKE